MLKTRGPASGCCPLPGCRVETEESSAARFHVLQPAGQQTTYFTTCHDAIAVNRARTLESDLEENDSDDMRQHTERHAKVGDGAGTRACMQRGGLSQR
jgi:hypothetical protein